LKEIETIAIHSTIVNKPTFDLNITGPDVDGEDKVVVPDITKLIKENTILSVGTQQPPTPTLIPANDEAINLTFNKAKTIYH